MQPEKWSGPIPNQLYLEHSLSWAKDVTFFFIFFCWRGGEWGFFWQWRPIMLSRLGWERVDESKTYLHHVLIEGSSSGLFISERLFFSLSSNKNIFKSDLILGCQNVPKLYFLFPVSGNLFHAVNAFSAFPKWTFLCWSISTFPVEGGDSPDDHGWSVVVLLSLNVVIKCRKLDEWHIWPVIRSRRCSSQGWWWNSDFLQTSRLKPASLKPLLRWGWGMTWTGTRMWQAKKYGTNSHPMMTFLLAKIRARNV